MRRCRNHTFRIIAFLYLLCIMNLTAQEDKRDHIIVDHADSLVGMEVNGEQARQLIGNVKMTHGTTIVTCERAIQFLKSNKVSLQGEVIVYDDSMALYTNSGMYYADGKFAEGFDGVRVMDGKSTLRAKYGKYYTETKRGYFKGFVSVEDSASRLTSDELTTFRDSDKTVADGNVKIVNRENRMTIFGEHFENNKKIRHSIMTVNPRALQIDSAGDNKFDTLFIWADSMQSFQDSLEKLITTGNVTLKRGSFTSESGLTNFYTKFDSIEMKRSPVVWYEQSPLETTQVMGDSIFVKLEKRKLRRMDVRGNAVAVSQADSIHRARYNQMSGQILTMLYTNNAVDRIDIDKTVTLLYYVFDGADPNGLNKSTGDHGTLTFANKKIDKVKVVGGVEGEYFPEKMIRDKEIDYNINAFSWHSPKPRKTTALN